MSEPFEMTIEVWRQESSADQGHWETHVVPDATAEMSLLDLIDRMNAGIVAEGGIPVVYDSDCREGICGACGVTVDGRPHGPVKNTPSCRQHLRAFGDQRHIRIEPLRAEAFPVVKDLMVDRSALDRLVQRGGTVAVTAGRAPDADALPVGHADAERTLDYAACIGCGACVAACPNGAAHLFAGAKLAHLSMVPQGKVERSKRAKAMVTGLEEEFGPCSTYAECVEVCPANIPLTAVAKVQREKLRAFWRGKDS